MKNLSNNKLKRTTGILLMIVMWVLVALLVYAATTYYLIENSSKERDNVYSVVYDGKVFDVDHGSGWYVSGSQFEGLMKVLGMGVIANPVNSSVVAFEENNVSADPSLKPLVPLNKDIIDEKDIYGNWLSSDQTNVTGYQFQASDNFGPHTVIQITGLVAAQDNSGDITKIGFYEVDSDNNLTLIFKKLMPATEDILQDITETETWSITQTPEFLTLNNGERKMIMSRINDEENSEVSQ